MVLFSINRLANTNNTYSLLNELNDVVLITFGRKIELGRPKARKHAEHARPKA